MILENKKTAIINVNIFDGYNIIPATSVVIKGKTISQIGGKIPSDAQIIDAKGSTLLPGLMDAHVHTSLDSLAEAAKFGITTELEMMGGFTEHGRNLQLNGKIGLADVRSAGMGLTAPGGHPDELMPSDKGGIPDFILKKMEKMSEEEKAAFIAAHEEDSHDEKTDLDTTTIEGAIQFVQKQVSHGADYIKIMIEEGSVLNAPNLPLISEDVMKAAVDEAHKHNKLVIAHILTAEAAQTAVNIGVDGLAHLFIDRPEWTPGLIKQIAEKNIFVTPCLVLNSSILGHNACHIAHDARVIDKLEPQWKDTMCSCFNTFPEGNMQDNFDNVFDLYKAGVTILAGTDVSVPVPSLGGLAHGVSVHHEMQFLVQAGLTPIEALRCATSNIASVFGLTDRGRIVEGARADLLLVKGDPTKNISDTLSIESVWLNGSLQNNQKND